jgi:hypothetical protein
LRASAFSISSFTANRRSLVHHLFAQALRLMMSSRCACRARLRLCDAVGANLGIVAVADGLDQQVLEAAVFEHLAQDVEDAAAQRLALDFELLEQALEHVALAGLGRDHVPQVADLGLADAVDAAEALLQAVGVPRQVVVDHQVGVLQVHAFAGGVGGEQHAAVRVVAEQLLHLAALFALHAAVDHDDGLLAADQAARSSPCR